jgi:hypothetical protein
MHLFNYLDNVGKIVQLLIRTKNSNFKKTLCPADAIYTLSLEQFVCVLAHAIAFIGTNPPTDLALKPGAFLVL